MKRFRKPLCIGLLLGALELGAAGLLAGVGRLASFTDLAFGLGVATLLLDCCSCWEGAIGCRLAWAR